MRFIITLLLCCIFLEGIAMDDKDYEQLLSHQLEMTPKTWKQLQSHGITDKTDIILDFLYYAPTQESAKACKAFFDNYDIKIKPESVNNKDGLWLVNGTSSPTRVDEEILLQWVDYMVAAGWDNNCIFDGWGATVPNE